MRATRPRCWSTSRLGAAIRSRRTGTRLCPPASLLVDLGGLGALRGGRGNGDAHYEKFHRTAQAWAIVGVAAMVRRSNANIAEARVALTNMGPIPVRATAVERALAGAEATAQVVGAAAEHAAEGTQPPSDLSGSA